MAHQLTQIPPGVPRSGSSKNKLVLQRLKEKREEAAKATPNQQPALALPSDSMKQEKNITPANDLSQLFKDDNKKLFQKNYEIEDFELDKGRAFLVATQRPSIAIRLLQKEREEKEVDEEFRHSKKVIIERAVQLDRNQDDFVQENNSMIERVKQLEREIKHIAEKKKREEAQIQKEKELIDERVKEIEKLTKEKEMQNARLEVLCQKIARHQKYKRFLEQACEAGKDEFGDIQKLMSRFDTLREGTSKLSSHNKELEEEIDAQKLYQGQELDQMRNEILSLNSRMHNLQSQIEELGKGNKLLEAELLSEMEHKNDAGRIMSRAIQSIFNIHKRVDMKKQTGDTGRDGDQGGREILKESPEYAEMGDMMLKLKEIKDRITDLNELTAGQPPFHLDSALEEEFLERNKKKGMYEHLLLDRDREFRERIRKPPGMTQTSTNRPAVTISAAGGASIPRNPTNKEQHVQDEETKRRNELT